MASAGRTCGRSSYDASKHYITYILWEDGLRPISSPSATICRLKEQCHSTAGLLTNEDYKELEDSVTNAEGADYKLDPAEV